MLPDLVSRGSERRAMRDEAIAEHDEEIKALRARCARLRAALAGVVIKEGREPAVESFDVALTALRQVSDTSITIPWMIEVSCLLAALLVLRETAGEEKA